MPKKKACSRCKDEDVERTAKEAIHAECEECGRFLKEELIPGELEILKAMSKARRKAPAK